ncbi:hypothetical protein JCGZ_03255 [Jatropha curcas]|uniref:Uncharacterized protein n=1 Tax=Jatropha curcas TaxID=180498 RepID=A0A067JDH9_JATCU|nr:hypothetical protein JCGZ_03255 [Jatropha curcas]
MCTGVLQCKASFARGRRVHGQGRASWHGRARMYEFSSREAEACTAWGMLVGTGVLQIKCCSLRGRSLHGLGCATLHGRANQARSRHVMCWKFRACQCARACFNAKLPSREAEECTVWGVLVGTGVLQCKSFLARGKGVHGLGRASWHGRASNQVFPYERQRLAQSRAC